MNKYRRIVPVGIAIFVLILSCVYCIKIVESSGYDINIGRPIVHDDSMAVDFTESPPLKDKDAINDVIFALLYARHAESQEIPTDDPDSVVWISDPRDGILYLEAAMWVREDQIFFSFGSGNDQQYRVIDDSYYFSKVAEMVYSHLDRYLPLPA